MVFLLGRRVAVLMGLAQKEQLTRVVVGGGRNQYEAYVQVLP